MTEEELQDKLANNKNTGFYNEHQEELSSVIDSALAYLGNAPDPIAVAEVHKRINETQEKIKYNDHLQCGKQQCSYCCHSEIFISKAEADYIKFNNPDVEINQELLAKQRNTNYKQLSFADKACIMLKAGRCQVYEHRPALCRNHGISAGEDPQSCYEQGTQPAGTVEIQQPRAILLEALCTAITIRNATSIEDIKNIAKWDW